MIRVLEGGLRLERGLAAVVLTPDRPGLVPPEEHRVEPLGPMRVQADFYDSPPERFV